MREKRSPNCADDAPVRAARKKILLMQALHANTDMAVKEPKSGGWHPCQQCLQTLSYWTPSSESQHVTVGFGFGGIPPMQTIVSSVPGYAN